MTSLASGAFVLALAMAAQPALSQGMVVAPSPSSRPTIDLFDQPGAPQPSRQASPAELGLPLAFSKTEAGHHAVMVDSRSYWIRGSQVQIRRDPAAGMAGGCKVALRDGHARTGQTPGAGSGC